MYCDHSPHVSRTWPEQLPRRPFTQCDVHAYMYLLYLRPESTRCMTSYKARHDPPRLALPKISLNKPMFHTYSQPLRHLGEFVTFGCLYLMLHAGHHKNRWHDHRCICCISRVPTSPTYLSLTYQAEHENANGSGSKRLARVVVRHA